MSDLIEKSTITAICGWRDAALAKMTRAATDLEAAFDDAKEAEALAANAHAGASFHGKDRSKDSDVQVLFTPFNAPTSIEAYRRKLDAQVWLNILEMTGMKRLMDRKAKDDFYDQLCGDVPQVDEETAYGMLQVLAKDSRTIFQRGLANAFANLDRRFRSHDAFKLGSRIILTNVFDDFGSWNYRSRMFDTLDDLDRIFAVLDKRPPHNPDDPDSPPAPLTLRQEITNSRNGRHGTRQSAFESDYFRVRTFKNGNVHLWFTRDDLVELANLQLAEFYGAVMPDATDRDGKVDLRSKAGVPAKRLSFYATPDDVVERMLREVDLHEARVLEPSAGTGAIVKHVLAAGATSRRRAAAVQAIEIDHDRCLVLKDIHDPRLAVAEANFLNVRPDPRFTHVLMNPPFYGTHWMEHVVHAFDFLAPGGTLVTVLPISADLGETKKHHDFRTWASEHNRWGDLRFEDLPPESFVESGTRINTVLLTLHKKK